MTVRTEITWERRVWPERLTPLARAFAAAGARVGVGVGVGVGARIGERERREDVYLLAPGAADQLAKLRGGARFEIKERLSRRGALECWRKTSLAELSFVPDELPVGANLFAEAARRRRLASLQDVLDALAPGVWPMRVRKSRRLYDWRGVRLETTVAAVAGRRLGTAALESPHSEPAAEAAEIFPLRGQNRDYGARLRAL